MIKDYAVNNDYDLIIEDGDFVEVPGDAQACGLLIDTARGDWRDAPTLGVHGEGFLNGPAGHIALEATLRRQLGGEGMRLNMTSEGDAINIEISA